MSYEVRLSIAISPAFVVSSANPSKEEIAEVKKQFREHFGEACDATFDDALAQLRKHVKNEKGKARRSAQKVRREPNGNHECAD